jgi:hypothetical protein
MVWDASEGNDGAAAPPYRVLGSRAVFPTGLDESVLAQAAPIRTKAQMLRAARVTDTPVAVPSSQGPVRR